jgi:hypothetical protein
MTGAGAWRCSDRAVLGAGWLVGAVVVTFAWYRAGRTADGADQLVWLEVGVAGVVAAAFTAALWVGSGRRAVCRRRVRLLGMLGPAPDAADAVVTGVAGAALLLAIPRGGRYHRPSCVLVAGRAAVSVERSGHEAAGRVACEVCRP